MSHGALIDCADDVWRIVYRLLNDPEEARECYQQAFLDGLRLDADSVQNWRAMMCRIATRRAMDQLRRRYRDRDKLQGIEHEPSLELPPEQQLEDAELRELVRSVLASLPPHQAEAFWLRHIEQLNQDEIAQQLGIRTGHVRVLVHRAIVCLREALGPIYGIALSSENEYELP
ncbi:MAG: RNA polymerase sigma factor [Rubripirellula sp.]